MLKLLPLLVFGCACAAPAENAAELKAAAVAQKDGASDLNTDATSYYDRYSEYGSRSYPSTYGGGYGASVSGYGAGGYGGVGGYGTGGNGAGYAGVGGYGAGGYGGVTGYGDNGYGLGGSDGYDRGYPGSYGGVGGYAGYDRGYGASSGGYGGYGGSGGNGGLNSYYGYNNPSYQGYGHTGYGYYNRRPGSGSIYGSGITPSLVTGYRGYSRK